MLLINFTLVTQKAPPPSDQNKGVPPVGLPIDEDFLVIDWFGIRRLQLNDLDSKVRDIK